MRKWLSAAAALCAILVSILACFVPGWVWEYRISTLQETPLVRDMQALQLTMREPESYGAAIMLSKLELSDGTTYQQMQQWIQMGQGQLENLADLMGWDVGDPDRWITTAQPFAAATAVDTFLLWMIEIRIPEIDGYVRLWLDQNVFLLGLQIQALQEQDKQPEQANLKGAQPQTTQEPDEELRETYTLRVLELLRVLRKIYAYGSVKDEITRLDVLNGVCEFTLNLEYVVFDGRWDSRSLILDPQEMRLSEVPSCMDEILARQEAAADSATNRDPS